MALRAWMAFVFLLVLAAELVGAYWIIYKNGSFMGDATARTANAYYVLFLQPHKLASIGFVWNPLPSLVQLLILPFSRLWRPLATYALAGSLATALFAAGNAALLFRYFKQAALSTASSMALTLLYAFNPFVFFYGLNGMSETFFFTSLIVCTANMALWTDDRRTGRLVATGLMLAIGFLTRYETFALALAVGLAMLIAIYLMQDRKSPFAKKPAKMKWDYAVATGTVLFLPVLYTIGMWMFLNWSIMGDPLFFFDSAYSNESQSSVALYSGFKEIVSNPWTAFIYVLVRLLPFLPPFLVITGERLVTKRLAKADYLILLVFVGVLTGFHYVMLVSGKSFGWLRFYCFVLICSIAWAPFELSQLKGRTKKWTILLLCLSLLVSAAILPSYFQDEDLAKEESKAFSGNDMGLVSEQMALAGKINEKYAESTVLLDAFMTSSIILNIDHPENLVTNIADDIFDLATSNPQEQLIDYVVVPTHTMSSDDSPDAEQASGVGALDTINRKHPRLYQFGADWADLVFEVEGFRLYKVLQWDENTAALCAHINSEYGEATLLFDSSTTGILHKNLKKPENAITLTSKNFEAAVADPMDYGVDYIIVPNTLVDASGSRDDILQRYPELMKTGTVWTDLVYENDLYRMYEVLYPEGWVKVEKEGAPDTGEVSDVIMASAEQLELANFINATDGRILILIDPAQEKSVLDLLRHPESVFTAESVGFESAVLAPQDYQVRYMVLPARGAPGTLQKINRLLPTLYRNGPEQAELVFKNDAYRVYELEINQ